MNVLYGDKIQLRRYTHNHLKIKRKISFIQQPISRCAYTIPYTVSVFV